ncbi:kinase [Actinoplanes sichuanensis]|uniref:AAA family ATPase n=1 Tax=Actinoplanes sichuanensis TaxID=512349 RepID=A0ABW4A4S6_9ACTN|nr:AAA family ATPase [Actinoplanes sichuanensis]BEL05741.1 kinase [Actinoplanes sichuanensis]
MTAAPCVECNSAGSALLLVIRGNSGSGKTTTAREVRRRYGARGLALVEQDMVRRVILREHGGGGGSDRVAPGLIATMVQTALDGGYHVILEGILHTGQYGDPLRELIAKHPGRTACYFMDVSFEETVRRHRRRAEPIPVEPETMRSWYAGQDLLGVPGEQVIPEDMGFADVVMTILHASGLAQAAPLAPCPTRCARCTEKAAATTVPTES